MSRMERHNKKGNGFKKFYFAYLGLIVVALIALFFYVRSIMIEYERNNSSNYVVWLATEADSNSQLGKYLEDNNFSDTRYGDGERRKELFYETIKTATLEAKQTGVFDASRPIYTITADGLPFMDIAISEQGSSTKLGIMTLSDWAIDYCILRNPASEDELEIADNGKLNYKLVVPEGFSIIVDDVDANGISPSAEVPLSDFEYVADFVESPKGLVYELKDISYEPNIVVTNNGYEPVAVTKQADGSYLAEAKYASNPNVMDLIDDIGDPLEIGKIWSRFMTDDVGGPSHGRDTVIKSCRLLKGTNLYDLAIKWASNVDITFVSSHSLDGWSNEKVDNFVKYNDKLMSCDVYFEKNMTIARGLGPRTDVFSNRMFFGNVDGTWYLLDMLSLEY